MTHTIETIELEKFKNLDKQEFTAFFNSFSGAKPGYLIGTGQGEDENLAIFNSITHIGARPPLLGFIQRPTTVDRHTYQNILTIFAMNFIRKILLFILLSAMTSCGTARGVLYGTGTVLEGVATDVRTVGNWIK